MNSLGVYASLPTEAWIPVTEGHLVNIGNNADARLILVFVIFLLFPPICWAVPSITGIKTSENGSISQVEISASEPLTFIYYTLSSPPRAVIEIAQTDASAVARQVSVDSPVIAGITVEQIRGATLPIARLTITLNDDARFSVSTAPTDKNRIIGRLSKNTTPATEVTAEDEDEKKPAPSLTGAGPDTAPLEPDSRTDQRSIDKDPAAVSTADLANSPADSAPAAPVAEQGTVVPALPSVPAAPDKLPVLEYQVPAQPRTATVGNIPADAPLHVTDTGIVIAGSFPAGSTVER